MLIAPVMVRKLLVWDPTPPPPLLFAQELGYTIIWGFSELHPQTADEGCCDFANGVPLAVKKIVVLRNAPLVYFFRNSAKKYTVDWIHAVQGSVQW
jgi:hypothetical protein